MIRLSHNALPYVPHRRNLETQDYPPPRFGGRASHRPTYPHPVYEQRFDEHSNHPCPMACMDLSRRGLPYEMPWRPLRVSESDSCDILLALSSLLHILIKPSKDLFDNLLRDIFNCINLDSIQS